jgi:hypothetical protein
VSLGALGDIKGAHDTLKEVPGLLKKKNNQIEAYVSRRVSIPKFYKIHLSACIHMSLFCVSTLICL